MRTVAGVLGILVGLVAVASSLIRLIPDGAPRERRPPLTIEVPAQLAVDIDYRSNPERLAVTETRTLARTDLLNAVDAFNREAVLSASPGRETRGEQLTLDELEDSIGSGLTKAGWTEITHSTLRLRFERRRDQLAVRHSVVPAERTNVVQLAGPSASLAISSGDARARRVPIDLPIAEGSRVRVSAPDRSIGETFPKASDEQTRPSDKRQMLELDLDEDTRAVELEIRSRPFRNEVGERLVNLTHWSALGWLLALIIAVANEGFRDWLKARLFGKQDPRPTQGNQAH